MLGGPPAVSAQTIGNSTWATPAAEAIVENQNYIIRTDANNTKDEVIKGLKALALAWGWKAMEF